MPEVNSKILVLLYMLYQGMFETKPFIVPDKAFYKKDLNQKSVFWETIKSSMDEEDLVCSEITVNGIKYQNGDLIVNEVIDGGDALKVGIVKTILVKSNQVFLVNKQYVAVRESLGYYESKYVDTEILVLAHSNLADIKPLIMRGTETRFQVVMHYYISFDYC